MRPRLYLAAYSASPPFPGAHLDHRKAPATARRRGSAALSEALRMTAAPEPRRIFPLRSTRAARRSRQRSVSGAMSHTASADDSSSSNVDATSEPDTTTSNAPTTKTNVSKIAIALGVLADHPDWTDKEIAKAAECSPATLSRNPKYRAARTAIRASGASGARRAARHRSTDMDKYEDE